MGEPVKLGRQLEVRDHFFDVWVTTGGQFQAVFDGLELYDPTLAGLQKKLQDATRKRAVKIDVPFTRVHTAGRRKHAQNGRVYGIHGGSGSNMVEWDDGSKEQDTYRHGVDCKQFTEEEHQAFEVLAAEEARAVKAMGEFLDARDLDLRQAVGDAIRATGGDL